MVAIAVSRHLRGNANARALTPHAAFEKVTDLQSRCNFRLSCPLVLEIKRGCATHYVQAANRRELVQQLLRQPVCKMLFLDVVAHVDERQNKRSTASSDNLLHRSRRRAAKRSIPPLSARRSLHHRFRRRARAVERSTGVRSLLALTVPVQAEAIRWRESLLPRAAREVPLRRVNESITHPWNCFNEARSASHVAQHLAQPRDRVVQPVVEIDIDIRRPHFLAQLITRNDLILRAPAENSGPERAALAA